LLATHLAAYRKVWNWALAERKQLFDTGIDKGRFTNSFEQKKRFNALKNSDPDWKWVSELSTYVYQEPMRIMDKVFKAFWKARKAGRKVGFPKFKNYRSCTAFKLTVLE
jgi:transposase